MENIKDICPLFLSGFRVLIYQFLFFYAIDFCELTNDNKIQFSLTQKTGTHPIFPDITEPVSQNPFMLIK